jgi:hypothetical protein
MKHFLFKSILFSILVFSCQDSKQKIEPKIARVERAKVSSLQNEEYLLPILDAAGFNIRSSKSGRVDKLSNVDGVFLNTDSILMVLQPDSVSYAYTFLAEKSARQGSFKNLVLHKVKDGYWAYFQEFTPKETIKNKSNFSLFTGTINRYDLSNKLLSTWNYERGAPATLSGGRTQSCVNFNLVCTEWTKKFDDQALTFTVGPPCNKVAIEISANSACFITDTVVPGGGTISRQFSMGSFLEYFSDGGPGGGRVGSTYGSSLCGSSDGGSAISNGSTTGSCDFSIGVFPPSEEELKRLLEEYIELIADPEEKRKAQLDYIKKHDGEDGRHFSSMVEEIVSTPGITVGDVIEINATVNKYYLNLRGRYFIAVYNPFAKAARFLLELALIETGTEVLFSATKLALSTRYGILATQAARQTWNGFANIFKANTDDILAAAKRIKDYRKSTGNLTGGNYGYLEGSANGKVVDNKMWRSSEANAQIEPQIFDAIEVTGSNGGTWLRNTDSEYKMLNKLASDLGAVKGGRYPNITGEIKIVSENPYCASCQGIIQQFNQMFPNIKLILIDGAK